MKKIISDLNRKEMIDELRKQGFTLSEIVEKAQETVNNKYLWFELINHDYRFIVMFTPHAKKRWCIGYQSI